jgi:hypothetical protein
VERKIFNIELDRIQKHPLQDSGEGYQTNVDFKFLESIKTLGVLQPITLSNFFLNPDGQLEKHNESPEGTQNEPQTTDARTFVLVSGHNRLDAAMKCGFVTIPCEFKEYETPELMEIDYLEFNRQREKTKQEKFAELSRYKQILSQVSKYKNTIGLKKGDKQGQRGQEVTFGTLSQMANFEGMVEFLERMGIDPSQPIDSKTMLSGLTGLSEREVRYDRKVNDDDYMGDKQDRWEKFLESKSLNPIFEQWRNIRREYEKGEIGLTDAAKAVDALLNKVESRIDKQEGKKVKSADRPLCYMSLPVSYDPEAAEVEAKVHEAKYKSKFRIINPVKVGKDEVKAVGRELEWVEYMERLLPKVKEATHYLAVGSPEQRRQSIGCRIEDVVAVMLNKKIVIAE